VTKGKVSFRNARAQAQHAARSLHLESQGTERNYEQALKGVAEYLKEQKLGDLRNLDKEKAELYLEMRSQEIGQKTLDLDRQAIQALIGQKLEVVKSEKEQTLKSRAYTTKQAHIVASAQTERNALATLIAENAGLRAHELLTLRPAHQRPADTHREYRKDRFSHRENTRLYTVEGKGGLCREIAIDNALAAKLEERRLEKPQQIYDRHIGYQQHYDIGGGKSWSDSFSKASSRELGWSNGAHGLRHAYAQQRMNTLQGAGYAYRQALAVVSEEMGHFRPDITEVYLR
jgi:integrase